VSTVESRRPEPGFRASPLLRHRFPANSRLSSSRPRPPYFQYGSVGRSGRARDFARESAPRDGDPLGIQAQMGLRRTLSARPQPSGLPMAVRGERSGNAMPVDADSCGRGVAS
jgi:hypothetical protein